MNLKKIVPVVFSIVASIASAGSQVSSAQWIMAQGVEASSVAHYRLEISLSEKPTAFEVQLTADSIYRFYVNGTLIATGPASGDLKKWRYDTLDIAPHLRVGENVLAAVVWHPSGDWQVPMALMQGSPGFYLRSDAAPSVNTGVAAWKTFINPAYAPQKRNRFKGYFALGDFENFDANVYPWGWETNDFDDRDWVDAELGKQDYRMIPRQIPMMEHRSERLQAVRRTEGADLVNDRFLEGHAPLTIPAHSEVTLLLDRGELSNAYPELTLSGGKDGVVQMAYAESLMLAKMTLRKGDRSKIQNKVFEGPHDQIKSDGGQLRSYRPLWFRTFRYIQLHIVTDEDPLTLVDLKTETIGYPFEEIASFDAGQDELERIWDVGWRTLRLCAVDNFYDCPFYERLQYVGDTRIEALISVYVSGDSRLMRKAIDLFRDSQDGYDITASRYPSRVRQEIPTFCNWWIAMVHDYKMLEGDRAFIEEMMPTIESIISRFQANTDTKTGLVQFSLGREWDFVDWAGHLAHLKERRSNTTSPSGLLTLNHLYAVQHAAEIMRYIGRDEQAEEYLALGERLKLAVMTHCWDEDRGLLTDDPGHQRLTEHVNLLGILTDTIPPAKQAEVMQKILDGQPSMTQATIYFRFYYNRALVKVGMADRYLDTLDIWRAQLELNLSTWAEKPEPSRSDCHAWGASPNYEFLATVAGITPTSPGFKKVRIAPALGSLQEIEAQMPTKHGLLQVKLKRKGTDGIDAMVTLPAGISGRFEWNGKSQVIEPGEQMIHL